MISKRLRAPRLAIRRYAGRRHRPRGATGDIEDPFIDTFFSRIPQEVAASFTPAQLDAVKLAFGTRVHGAHAIDMRLTVPLGRRWGYLVLLAGLEHRTFRRRSLGRLLRSMLKFSNAMALSLFVLLFVGSLLAVVYVGKRSAGLNVFPGIDMLNDRKMERMLH